MSVSSEFSLFDALSPLVYSLLMVEILGVILYITVVLLLHTVGCSANSLDAQFTQREEGTI